MNLSPSSALAIPPLETSIEAVKGEANASDANASDANASDANASGEAHLLFRVQGALFAVEAALVREIFALPELAPLAQAPPFVLGVLNLRGSFVPVLDLARRLGRVPQPMRTSDILIVLEWPGVRIGVLVNEVLHVAPIPLLQQEPLPEVGRSISEAPFVRAIARVGRNTAMLLHAQNLLRTDIGTDTQTDIHSAPVEGKLDQGGTFAPHASEAEREVFAERARRLGREAGEQESSDLVPLAIVSLGGEPFGIGLENVREFVRAGAVTPVPCCPPHIVGQMNLRGDILSLLDICPLLRLPSASRQAAPRVVVAESSGVLVGVLVDEVLDVIYIPHSDLQKAPSVVGESGKYFAGGVRHGERILGMLDLPRILSEDSLIVDETV